MLVREQIPKRKKMTREMMVEMYVHIYRLLQTYAALRPLSTVLCERRHGMYGLLLLFNGVRNEIAVIVIAVDGTERKIRMVRLLGYR
jgi:hypothetical protein